MNILGVDLISYLLGTDYLYDLNKKRYVLAIVPPNDRYCEDYGPFFVELIKEIRSSKNRMFFRNLKVSYYLDPISEMTSRLMIDHLIYRIREAAGSLFVMTQITLAFAEIPTELSSGPVKVIDSDLLE